MGYSARLAEPRIFNRLCSIFVLCWVLLACGAFVRMPMPLDSTQYRLAGVTVRYGESDSLYPFPSQDSFRNPGAPEDSELAPRQLELAKQFAVPHAMRFISPPPVALLSLPFGFGGYWQSHRLFLFIGAIAAWRSVVQAGKIHQILTTRKASDEGQSPEPQESRTTGWLMLLVGCSLMMYGCLRIGNVSTIIGWLLGGATIDLLNRKTVRPALSLAFAATLKYIGLAYAPLLLLTRRIKTLIWSAIFLMLIFGITWAIMGSGPFEDFYARIVPTLHRSFQIGPNQSVEAMLMRYRGTNSLPEGWKLCLNIARAGMLVLVMALLIRRTLGGWDAPSLVAGALSLIIWMLVFSPIFWFHYHAYLVPFWGYLFYEAAQSRNRRIIVAIAIAIVWVPFPMYVYYHPPEPFDSLMLYSAVLMWMLSLWRLSEPVSGNVHRPQTVEAA